MKNDKYSAAVHEAGHVVVARALGLKTRVAAAGIIGDDNASAAEIEDGSHLTLIEQIALCSAGVEAQRMLNVPTNDIGTFLDMAEINDLIDELDEAEGNALRLAGYHKSKQLLELHRDKVLRLACALAECTELDQEAIEQILSR
jgi:ATP-dependent Zn protease